MRHGMYWTAINVPTDWAVSSGHRNELSALNAAEQIPQGNIRIELLDTIECDIANDNPAFSDDQTFPSQRWCVLVRS